MFSRRCYALKKETLCINCVIKVLKLKVQISSVFERKKMNIAVGAHAPSASEHRGFNLAFSFASSSPHPLEKIVKQ